jgi:hypothetical protein
VAVIATIIYTDNVIRSRKATSASSTNLDNNADSDDYYVGATGTDSSSSYIKKLTGDSKMND